MSQPLTEQQLDEIQARAAHLHEYACQDDGEGDTLAGTDVPLLLTEVRRLRAELAAGAEPPLSPDYEHPACGFHWHGKDGMDIPVRDGEPVCPRCELARVGKVLAHRERRCEELRVESKRRGRNVLEHSEKNRVLERKIDGIREQLGAEILRAGQAEDTLDRVRVITRRLANHAVGFGDVLDESDRGPWGRTVGADIAELSAAVAPDAASAPPAAPLSASQPSEAPVEGETAARASTGPLCLCGHPVLQHHEDVCLRADCDCADCLEPEGPLPDRLEAVLTQRFTELGNPYSRMRIAFQGPDGWPASKEVGPHDVAEVLRELLAATTEDLASADNPTHLRWGLNDVLWSDDDSVIVLLSGPDLEPYWLELDPERAAVLREDLAGPDGAPSPERDALIAELLPAWEAMYEPGNVSDYLIGYANSEAAAKGAAEAWMRSQAEVTGRLEWEQWSDAALLPDGYDVLFELIQRHDDGIDTGPGIAVRRRTQPAT